MSWRGGERQIAFLAQELQKRNIPQLVFCAKNSKMAAWCEANDVSYYNFSKSISLNPFTAWQIWNLCNKNVFSHVHTHDSHAHTFAILAQTLFRINIPIIVHRRVDFPIKNNWLSLWKYNHPAIKTIICVSHFVKKILEPSIENPQLIKVVYSGIDLDLKPSKTRLNLRKDYQVPSGYHVIVNVAAIAPHKDYYTFVNTAELLLKKGLPARFFIIGGDGGEQEKISAFINKIGLQKDLLLMGFRTDVPNLLSQSDLMLFTSKTEGLGGATLDAFLAGVPVVTTAVGGVPEIVENGKTGLLAPIGDAMKLADQVCKMLNDNILRKNIIKNAKERTSLFSKEITAEKIIAIYQSNP